MATNINHRVSPAGVPPVLLLQSYDPSEWEVFVQEWKTSFENKYKLVDRIGGAGDMGRDVIGYLGEPSDPTAQWDNFQCKRYGAPLQPSHIWIELGKLCYFTWKAAYTPPRNYKFVAPLDPSPSLKELLKKPDKILEGLIDNWDTHCSKKITSTKDVQIIPLEGELLEHVRKFDFSILGYVPVVQLLSEHSQTKFWHTRFKVALPDRPELVQPPVLPVEKEARYVEQLFEAYADQESLPVIDLASLVSLPKLHKHFNKSREHFYQADYLDRFTRDLLPDGSFGKLQRQIFDGVEDVCLHSEHQSAFKRLVATTQAAANLPLAQDVLGKAATPGDKIGICHHLANQDELIWKQ